MPAIKTIIVILGDQLTQNLSSLRNADPATSIVLMAEVAAKASYVKHHKKKIAFLFSAMRHFAAELAEAGWTVDYHRLTDPENSGTLAGEVLRTAARHGAATVRLTEPGEWRLREELGALDAAFDLEMLPDDRFIASHAEFERWAAGHKKLRMEFFPRDAAQDRTADERRAARRQPVEF